MTTVNKCLALLKPADTSKSSKRVLVGQAERASHGLRDITHKRASFPQRGAREERTDSQPITHG
jgi:hypothetical protein